jgi:hypothetical protein
MTKHIEDLTSAANASQHPGAPLFTTPSEPARRVMLMAWDIGPDGKPICRWHPAYEAAPNLRA